VPVDPLNIHRNSVFLLVLAVIGLVGLGLVMLSSTAAFARESQGNAATLLQKQAVWLVVGALGCIAAAAFDYDWWRRTWWLWFIIAAVLLAFCLVPGIGSRVNGSSRWLKFGGISVQPSELAKLALVFALAWWYAPAPRRTGDNDNAPTVPVEQRFWKGFIMPLVIGGALMALIAPEVDLGATALIGATTFIVMFVAGARWRYLVPTAVLGVAALGVVLMKMPERAGRLLAFRFPERYPDDAYQGVQSLIALGSGGVQGYGLGFGRQKMGFLPFAHTDSIFAIIGEELGLFATLAVVFAFLLILLCGTVIAVRARDRFGMLLGFGIVTLLALQAAVNIGVTTCVLPNKGMPLPFISYGGTNLVFCLVCTGILISIWRRGMGDIEAKANVRLSARTGRRPRRI
jgi:cell division protein FtsW